MSALFPAHWKHCAQSFQQGVAERLKGGVQVKQIERVVVECLRFFCIAACAVNNPAPVTPAQTLFSLLPCHQALLLPSFPTPTLCSLPPWMEPAQSCQSACLCQPNYHTHLKGGETSAELPGVAFPFPCFARCTISMSDLRRQTFRSVCVGWLECL